MPLVLRKKGEGNKKKKMPKAPPSRPRHANPKHPMNTERTTGRNMARKKGGGKLKMVEKDGKKVPFFAADGIGKMNKGGPVEVKKGMTLSQIAKNNNTSICLLYTSPSPRDCQ